MSLKCMDVLRTLDKCYTGAKDYPDVDDGGDAEEFGRQR